MEIYEGKRQHQESSKSSRSPSPELREAPDDASFRPIVRTPPPSRAAPPPSPPVPTHPIAPVPPQPGAPLPLSPCPVCSRTFVPQSLAKHVKICEKMTVKKRKTFDSSRQRREGTDLEQYLPKNFGLPENSPFLEKSPPNTARPTPKPKVSSVKQTVKGCKPLPELQSCPHCSRKFGQRAFERHVEWCADKAKILPAAPAQPPPHIATAKQRLNARTQYKAPPVRGTRSSRDKSNSRSTSIDRESSRGVSPPAPRECGDYRHGRSRASESVSSTASIEHEDLSPHVPVIRSSRHSNNSSGDANVKARQARLARDLSSSSSNNIVSESLFPSPMKRSSSLLDSIQKKTVQRAESTKSRQKADQLEQDIMQSLKEFDAFYEPEMSSSQSNKETNYNLPNSGTTKRGIRKTEKSKKSDNVTNGNYTPNGKSTDSAYSSLNRISPSKLSVCNSKESNGSNGASPLDQIAGSDSSGCQKDDIRSGSSEEFLAMERSAELNGPIVNDVFTPSKENPLISADKRVSSRTSSRRGSAAWRTRGADLSSSGSEASLHRTAGAAPPPPARPSRFCHECGSKFPFDSAKFCVECGVKRLMV